MGFGFGSGPPPAGGGFGGQPMSLFGSKPNEPAKAGNSLFGGKGAFGDQSKENKPEPSK